MRVDRRSEPEERDIATRTANPSLASQAPRVSRINRKNWFIWKQRAWVNRTRAVRVRTIVSIVSRIIRRWVRWDRNRRVVRIRERSRREGGENVIAGGVGFPIFGLQDQCLKLASSASGGGEPIINTQS